MEEQEFNDEFEAHKILMRHTRSKVLSIYFSLQDDVTPKYMDAEDAVLHLIPIKYYESFFTFQLLKDPLTKKVINLSRATLT
jgi:hypothetical protein